MRYVLIGEDDYLIRQTLEEIKKGVGDQTILAANTTILNGQQVTADQLLGACETVPFLAEKRLVVVEGLLGRFETKNKVGKKKTANKNDRSNDRTSIVDAISRTPDFTELVLVDGKISNHNPLLHELSAVAQVRSFPLLKELQLRRWIEQRVAEAGGNISPRAVELLTRFVGSNLWIMAGEVDKLVMFAGARRIEEEDIRAVVSYAQEANVFAMVDAILEFKAGVAQELLQQLLKQGAVPAYLLVMLSRQVHLLVRVKELKSRGKTRGDIQNKLGLTSDFVLRKALEQADRYSPPRLRELYHKLLETDLSIKTGKYEGELALSILISDLCQRDAVSA